MRNIEVCPKCGARMIDEESDRHECDVPLRVSGDYLLLRNGRGFWRAYRVSDRVKRRLGEIPPELVLPSFTAPRGTKWEDEPRGDEIEPRIGFSFVSRLVRKGASPRVAGSASKLGARNVHKVIVPMKAFRIRVTV